MKKLDVESLRERLETLAERMRADASAIVEQVRNASGGNGNLSNAPIHLGDMGTDEFLYDMNTALLANEQYLAAEAQAALRRLDDGSFGRCESCGKPIARERLEALPYARYCVRCAEANGSIPEVNLNNGRPAVPADTLAPEGEMEEDRRSRRRPTMDARDRPVVSPDIYAAGTAGGGTAIGGLAGTNVGHGDPTISELQDATGSSNFDLDEDREDQDAPRSGPSGGAVGGTPARKRSS